MPVEQPAAAELADALARIEQLETALENRSVIARAQGRLMERYDLPEDAAIAILMRASSTLNIKVVQVAQMLLDTGQLPREILEPDQ